jgi:hypothetical protein
MPTSPTPDLMAVELCLDLNVPLTQAPTIATALRDAEERGKDFGYDKGFRDAEPLVRNAALDEAADWHQKRYEELSDAARNDQHLSDGGRANLLLEAAVHKSCASRFRHLRSLKSTRGGGNG